MLPPLLTGLFALHSLEPAHQMWTDCIWTQWYTVWPTLHPHAKMLTHIFHIRAKERWAKAVVECKSSLAHHPQLPKNKFLFLCLCWGKVFAWSLQIFPTAKYCKRERETLERESRGRLKSVPGFYILQLWHTCCWEIHAIQLYHSKLLSYRSSFAVLSWRRTKYMWRLPPKAWFQHFRFMKLTEPDIKVLCSIYMLWLRPHTYLHGKKSARK